MSCALISLFGNRNIRSKSIQMPSVMFIKHACPTSSNRIFYQGKSERLSTCILMMHMWLHAIDFMEKSGPLWTYWCWVMERFCSLLGRAIGSRKHPYTSLDRHVLDRSTLHSIFNIYNLAGALPSTDQSHVRHRGPYHHPDYGYIQLYQPRRVLDLQKPDLQPLHCRIAVYFSTRWNIPVNTLRLVIPTIITQFARLEIKRGDTISSFFGVRRQDGLASDATFLQYELVVDRYRNQRNIRPVLEPQTFFGRLNRVLSLR